MLYPMLHLHQNVNSERPAVDFYVQPARIESFKAIDGGGTLIYFTGDDSVCVKVNESPDMISKAITESISQQAAASTRGAIQMQLAAQDELSKKASKLAIPRINGG